MIFDLGSMLVNLYGTIRKDRELQDWFRLILSSVFSGFIAFTGTWGAVLMAGKPAWFAFGSGLCACSTAVFTIMLRMKQGRSLMIAAPGSVVEQYQTTSQTIEQPVENKK